MRILRITEMDLNEGAHTACLIRRRRSILLNRQEESAFLPLVAVIPLIGRRAIPYARTPTAREENR
ncbi:hypothetical protein [Actinoplanes italicus]|uniref:hypothetical protein n=1 Tax=Actinoplanes italicus TaxID=113567 RepID=UPI0011B204B1|nr:hypothetical protein [Actinoplanes italicus]